MPKTLVIDLETTSLSVEEARIVLFGAYDYDADKYYVYTWTDENVAKIMQLFEEYEYVVTFNGARYDLPILRRHGIPTTFKHVDLYQVTKYRRANYLKPGGFDSYALKALVLQLRLDAVGKEVIDYEVLKKDYWTNEERERIIKYLKQDLLSTAKLWCHVVTKCAPLAKYLSKEAADAYKHVTTTFTTYAYKVICENAGVPELYDEKPSNKKHPLTYMSNPRKPWVKGRTVLLKFNYLITQLIIQFNLLSANCKCCATSEGMFHGSNVYAVKGYYCRRNQGRVETFLKKLGADAKTNQDARLVNQIISSHLYDLVTDATYHSTYYAALPSDLLVLVKHLAKTLISKFEEAGLFVLYVDNDDVFVVLRPDQSISDVEATSVAALKALKNKMSFPSDDFELVVKDTISYVRFFSNSGNDKNKIFMSKGKYVYVAEDGRVFSKGVTSSEVRDALSKEYESEIIGEEEEL